MLVYKCLNNLVQEYVSRLLVPYTQECYGLRSNNLDVLSVHDSKHKTLVLEHFLMVLLLNGIDLPIALRLSSSVTIFKSKVENLSI